MNNNSNGNTNDTNTKLDGAMNKASGAIKQGAGKVMGDDEMVAKGKIDSAKGEAQSTIASLKDKAKAGLHVAGDAIEKVGEKLTNAGYEKVGNAVHKAGDKLEHSAD